MIAVLQLTFCMECKVVCKCSGGKYIWPGLLHILCLMVLNDKVNTCSKPKHRAGSIWYPTSPDLTTHHDSIKGRGATSSKVKSLHCLLFLQREGMLKYTFLHSINVCCKCYYWLYNSVNIYKSSKVKLIFKIISPQINKTKIFINYAIIAIITWWNKGSF